MLRDDDTRPIRPPSQLRQLKAPDYTIDGTAKSLWVNDVGMVTINMIAADDFQQVRINIFGPGLVPVRVRKIVHDGTTAKDIIAMYN